MIIVVIIIIMIIIIITIIIRAAQVRGPYGSTVALTLRRRAGPSRWRVAVVAAVAARRC